MDLTFTEDSATTGHVADTWGRLLSEEDAYPSVDLTADTVWFGRQPANTVVLDDKRVSSKHFRLFKHGGDVMIEDLSANGTFVNETRLVKDKPVPIHNGDQVGLLLEMKQAGTKPKPKYTFQDKRPKNTVAAPAVVAATATVAAAPAAGGIKRRLASGEDGEDDDDADATTKKIAVESSSGAAAPVAKGKEKEEAVDDDDEIEEQLVCGICHDLLYKTVCLIPCMHSYCGACYSDWMAKSNECPHCRTKVERISRQHTLNNLVDAYLAKHPHKKRSEDEIKDMDLRNKITTDMMKPPKRHGYDPDEDEGTDDEDEEDEDEDDDDDGGNAGPAIQFNQCPQCVPGNATGYVCPPGSNHLYCSFCARRFADRRNQANIVQACKGCTRICCQFYDGQCQSLNVDQQCNEARNFDMPAIPDGATGAFKGNTYELQILKDYLQSKNVTSKQCYDDCIAKLDNGTYTVTAVPNLRSTDKICINCARKAFAELCFKYRMDIPNADLPAAVTSRPDCHWGSDCRTQYNPQNPGHKERYSHICNRTHN